VVDENATSAVSAESFADDIRSYGRSKTVSTTMI